MSELEDFDFIELEKIITRQNDLLNQLLKSKTNKLENLIMLLNEVKKLPTNHCEYESPFQWRTFDESSATREPLANLPVNNLIKQQIPGCNMPL